MACLALNRAFGSVMFIRFISTGGTIDKIYFDAMSQFEVGESQVEHILSEGMVSFDYDIVQTLKEVAGEKTNTIIFPLPLDLIKPLIDLGEAISKDK